jgi:hypothetical protein
MAENATKREPTIQEQAAEARAKRIKAKAEREKAALEAPAHASTYRRAKEQLKRVQDDVREGRRPGKCTKEIKKLKTAIARFEANFKEHKAAANKRKPKTKVSA